MINIKTVFILGAGSSVPYGYPTGQGLRHQICTKFKDRYSQIKSGTQIGNTQYEFVKPKIEEFCKKFKDSSTPSIDLYLARNPEYAQFGKMAIALSILDSEKNSVFREDLKENSKYDWYRYICHKMTSTLSEPDSYKRFGENKVTFITFNYDRSLEHFLYESLKNSFNVRDTEILLEFKKIPILHVYGKVSDLPWENPEGLSYLSTKDDPYSYGVELAQKWAANIRIVHERTEADFTAIHNAISEAKRVFFLGFGYAPENIEILKSLTALKRSPQIYGTALGSSEKEINDAVALIRNSLLPVAVSAAKPMIRNADCLQLLRDCL